MSRAMSVIVGVSLVTSVWAWMVVSLTEVGPMWLTIIIGLCKVCAACLITAPVYREYLR